MFLIFLMYLLQKQGRATDSVLVPHQKYPGPIPIQMIHADCSEIDAHENIQDVQSIL